MAKDNRTTSTPRRATAAKAAPDPKEIICRLEDEAEEEAYGLGHIADVMELARPGGNLTGVSFLAAELNSKRFELLSEMVPQANVMALLVNPNNPSTERVIQAVQEAAQAKGVQLHILRASSETEIDAAFAALVQQQAGALLVASDPFLGSRREKTRRGLGASWPRYPLST